MAKLACIIGELIVRIACRETARENNRSIVTGLHVAPDGSCYRQAKYAREAGYGVFLVARLGDDHYGRLVIDSLATLGISTQFIEVSSADYTGINFEVRGEGEDEDGQRTFYDPGASIGPVNFRVPIENSLPLCNGLLVNQWVHPQSCQRILRLAAAAGVPSLYKITTERNDRIAKEADWVLHDSAIVGCAPSARTASFAPRLGEFVLGSGMLTLRGRDGHEIWRIPAPAGVGADELAVKLLGLMAEPRRFEDQLRVRAFLQGEVRSDGEGERG